MYLLGGEVIKHSFELLEDGRGKHLAYLDCLLFPGPDGRPNSARVKVLSPTRMLLYGEIDHDVHHFLNGRYTYSELGYLSSQKVLKRGVKLQYPKEGLGELEEDIPFNHLIVVLPHFSLEESIRKELSARGFPENHPITRTIGDYL